MARPLRIEYPGALYHITVRGNKKDSIFFDQKDRDIFLSIFANIVKTQNWICHAYCLMENHFHLCVETPEGNLSAGMHNLNGVYTQTFNKRHNTVGHLFQGRFKSFVIEKDLYFLEVVRYIVLNPVRAKSVSHPKDWLWSNYLATVGLIKKPDWLDVNCTRRFFSDDDGQAKIKYQEFVMDGRGVKSPFIDIREGIILGSDQFIHEIWEDNKETVKIKEIPKSSRIIGRPSLEVLFDPKDDKKTRNKSIKFARNVCGYSVSEIAEYLNLSCTYISLISRDKIDLKGKTKT